MFFASDNGSGVPPRILDALARANEGPTGGYGNDPVTARLKARLRDLFEAPEAEVHLVATGTAANALSIATFCPTWGAVYCHRPAHIEEDECGAPEFFSGGAKLALIDGDHGKIAPEALQAALDGAASAGVHNVQRGMVSLTNLTEAGTRYSPGEIAALAAIARHHDLPLHLDGARFANALAAEGCTPAEMTWRAGVDVLSLGGTKNGLLGVEAVIIFDPARKPGASWELELRRKRAGHLFSKHRYLAAQMEAWLEDDLWLDLARHANAMAARIEQGFARVPGAQILHPRGGNMIFARWPRGGHRAAQAAGARYYLWPMSQPLDGPTDTPLIARLVASWNTDPAEVDALLSTISA